MWCLDLWGRHSAPFMQGLHFCFALGALVAPLIADPFLSPMTLGPAQHHLGNLSLPNLAHVPPIGIHHGIGVSRHTLLHSTTQKWLSDQPNYSRRVRRSAEQIPDNTTILELNNVTELVANDSSDSASASSLSVTKDAEANGSQVRLESETSTVLPTSASVNLTTTAKKPTKPLYAEGLKSENKWDRQSQKSTLKSPPPIPKVNATAANGSIGGTKNAANKTAVSPIMLTSNPNSSQSMLATNQIPSTIVTNKATTVTTLTTSGDTQGSSRISQIAESPIVASSPSNVEVVTTPINYLKIKNERPADATNDTLHQSSTLTEQENEDTTKSTKNGLLQDPYSEATVVSTPLSDIETSTLTTVLSKSVQPATENPGLNLPDTGVVDSTTDLPSQTSAFDTTSRPTSVMQTSKPTSTTAVSAPSVKKDLKTTSMPLSLANLTTATTKTGTPKHQVPIIVGEEEPTSTTGTPTTSIMSITAKRRKQLPLQLATPDPEHSFKKTRNRTSITDRPDPVVVTPDQHQQEFVGSVTTLPDAETVSNKSIANTPFAAATEASLNTDHTADLTSWIVGKLSPSRLGKLELVYAILGTYLFVVSVVFLAFLCASPREPRSRQEEDNKVQGPCSKMSLILLSSLFFFLYMGMEAAVGELLQIYAMPQTPGAPQPRGYLLTYVFWGSFAAARGAAILASIKLSCRTMLLGALGICFFASVLLVAGADRMDSLLWTGVGVLGVGMASVLPTSLTWLERHVRVTNRAASIVLLGAAVGEMALPFLASHLVEREPAVVVYVNVSVVTLCCLNFGALWLAAARRGEKYAIEEQPDRSLYQLASLEDADETADFTLLKPLCANGDDGTTLLVKGKNTRFLTNADTASS